jgi:hypothetical protein
MVLCSDCVERPRWNRTGYCERCYFRRYRAARREKPAPVHTVARNLPLPIHEKKVCRCGAEAIARGMCRACYGRWWKRNPRKCACGNRYRGRGSKCGVCRNEAREDTWRLCACGKAVEYKSGECHVCRWNRIKQTLPRCICGRCVGEPVYKAHLCRGEYMRRLQRTPQSRQRSRLQMRAIRQERRATTTDTSRRSGKGEWCPSSCLAARLATRARPATSERVARS